MKNPPYSVFFVNKFNWIDKNPMTTISTFFTQALAMISVNTTLLVSGENIADTEKILKEYYGLENPPDYKIIIFKKYIFKRLKINAFFYWQSIRFIIKNINRSTHNVVITRNATFLPWLYFLKWRYGITAVYESHGYHGKHNLPGLPHRQKPKLISASTQYHITERIFLNRIDGVLFITAPQQSLYKKDFFKKPSIFLPLGSPQNSNSKIENHVMNDQFSLKTLVYIGRFTHHIDVEILFQALSLLIDHEIRFIWLGLKTNDFTIINSFIKKYKLENKVLLKNWIGHREMSDFIHNKCSAGLALYKNTFRSAAVTSPSKIFDYFAAGLPVIAPDIASVRDVIAHKQNGFLYKAGDAQSLAHEITALFTQKNMYRQLKISALESSEIYSWQNRARRFNNFIGELLIEK